MPAVFAIKRSLSPEIHFPPTAKSAELKHEIIGQVRYKNSRTIGGQSSPSREQTSYRYRPQAIVDANDGRNVVRQHRANASGCRITKGV
jgi:hypothetical protein